MKDIKETVINYIESHFEEIPALASRLISHNSVKAPAEKDMPFGKGAAAALAEFDSMCRDFGFTTKNFDNYALHADMDEKEPLLGILCHLDVVPEGTGWHSDPFKPEIRDGRLYGRGAIDDKGPAAAALFAMHCVKELGIPLKGGVRMIVGCDEENGSSDMEYYQKKEKFPDMLVTPDGDYPVINIEKGMLRFELKCSVDGIVTSLHGGKAINAVPECCEAAVTGVTASEIMSYANGIEGVSFEARNGSGTTIITAKGVCAHASTPELGHNAVTAMLRLLGKIPACPAQIKALSELFPYGETNGQSLGIACSDERSGSLTALLSVLDIENGTLCGKIDSRFPVTSTLADISGKLSGTLSEKGFESTLTLGDEPHFVDPDSDFIKTLLSVYTDITGKEGHPIAIGGGTYVHNTENGVAFGAEFPGEDNHMHGADESISLESLKLNAEIYAMAIIRLLAE